MVGDGDENVGGREAAGILYGLWLSWPVQVEAVLYRWWDERRGESSLALEPPLCAWASGDGLCKVMPTVQSGPRRVSDDVRAVFQ